jgi:hypothetical protein
VRPPRQIVLQGKTTALPPKETCQILDNIETTTVVGLRDRSLIALMVYTFVRVSAAIAMKV